LVGPGADSPLPGAGFELGGQMAKKKSCSTTATKARARKLLKELSGYNDNHNKDEIVVLIVTLAFAEEQKNGIESVI